VFTFLEWRATEDLLAQPDACFLHAAGVRLGQRSVLLVGDSGSGKSTLAAHLLVRGHRAWGDDLVRFALPEGRFSASPRSWKLDSKTLVAISLLAFLSAEAGPGMLLAPGVLYASPAAIRRQWQAPDAPADVVVLLDQADHAGPPLIERTSDGSAALRAARMLIGSTPARGKEEHTSIMIKVLEAMSDVTAYRARGTPPAALADALERELAA